MESLRTPVLEVIESPFEILSEFELEVVQTLAKSAVIQGLPKSKLPRNSGIAMSLLTEYPMARFPEEELNAISLLAIKKKRLFFYPPLK